MNPLVYATNSSLRHTRLPPDVDIDAPSIEVCKATVVRSSKYGAIVKEFYDHHESESKPYVECFMCGLYFHSRQIIAHMDKPHLSGCMKHDCNRTFTREELMIEHARKCNK